MDSKLRWEGIVLSVQPRIRLIRSFDQRSHTYLGFVIRIAGRVEDVEREVLVGIGAAAQEKHGFRVGDRVSGLGVAVADPRLETAELYKVSGVKLLERGPERAHQGAPFERVPPGLDVYRARRHRRLAARSFETKCASCMWGCAMAVEMIIDQWNPTQRRYRVETFCYGPKSCPLYAAGPTRKVPGRNGMSWEEEDWVDQLATAHRGEDE
jgi:hypothetical protein